MKLLLGDCLKHLQKLPGKMIDLTVTSPPYDNLRNYNESLNDWDSKKWEAIILELFRVTKEGGVVVWIVADATIKGSETGTSFKQALFAIQCGFKLHDTMIYAKSSQPRQSTRYEQAWEYMFVFSKGQPKTFNPIQRATENAGKFVKRTCRDGGKDTLVASFSTVAATTVIDNFWFYGVKEKVGEHPAVFPESLARDHILSWSNPGDTVLDPFLGSGTTGVACAKEDRRFVGFERDPSFFKLAETRIREAELNALL